MIAGVVLLLAASVVQALGVDTFIPLDRSGLCHVISMVGVALMSPGWPTSAAGLIDGRPCRAGRSRGIVRGDDARGDDCGIV